MRTIMIIVLIMSRKHFADRQFVPQESTEGGEIGFPGKGPVNGSTFASFTRHPSLFTKA